MLERFRDAIGTGEVLRIVYDGGSSPGAIRDILALAVLSENKVRAKCLTTGQSKTFVLTKMRLSEDGTETYVPAALRERRYSNLDDVFRLHEADIRRLGWFVQLADDDDEGRCLSVHKIARSSGRPLKGPFASITYKPMQWDLVFTSDDRVERTNVRPSVKPFTVRAKRAKVSSTFKDLEKAVERFLEEVRAGER